MPVVPPRELSPARAVRREVGARPVVPPAGSAVAFHQVLASAMRPTGSPPASPIAMAATRSGRIVGVDQYDPREYDNLAQAQTIGPSACAAAALTAVLRAQGRPVRIADVLRAMPGAIHPEFGLVNRPALVQAARSLGVAAQDDVRSFAALQAAVAAGQPVLVDITNARFPAGHFLVVTGLTEQQVIVADSSRQRLTALPRDAFLAAWSGRGIRLGPLRS